MYHVQLQQGEKGKGNLFQEKTSMSPSSSPGKRDFICHVVFGGGFVFGGGRGVFFPKERRDRRKNMGSLEKEGSKGPDRDLTH